MNTSLANYFDLVGALAPADVTSSSDHRGARAVLAEAWRRVVGREPTLPEIQAAQAVSLHETGYGKLGAFGGSHNWGAVQIPGTWGKTECPPGGLLWRDSQPKPDGTDEVKSVCFRTYADDVTGAVDLVRNLTIRRPKTLTALATGDADQVAAAMYLEHYYTGHGATPAERIAGYAKGLANRAAQIAKAIAEPLVVTRQGPKPTPSPVPKPTSSPVPIRVHAIEADLSASLPLAALLGLVVVKAMTGEAEAIELQVAPPAARVPVFADEAQTGDILPTFVTPDDAKRYVNETDADYERLDHAIQTSNATARFMQSWSVDLAAWRAFRDDALKNVGWLNTKATMEQTDRWKKKLSDWHDSFTKNGGQAEGPPPIAPAQGGPPSPSASAGWVQLALLVAGLFAFGYIVRGFRGVA